MIKRLVKTRKGLALVLDRPMLERLKIDASTRLEVSTDGVVIVVWLLHVRRRTLKLKRLVEEAHRQNGRVFRRLAIREESDAGT